MMLIIARVSALCTLIEFSIAIQTPEIARCNEACSTLHLVFPNKTSFPNSTIYIQESDYWSLQQAVVKPYCRFTPSTALDVSLTLKILVGYQCPFAIKSGGHANFAGASNIEGGVTIDFGNLNQVTLSEDKRTASLGSGARWADVYTKLEKNGLAVVGGRIGDIGVGGLALGGGISFFSGRYGFACDNVLNYEVVFADGSIHNVSPKSFPDIFWALRGGGNNFGVVTRFDVSTFPQGLLWGGSNYLSIDKAPALISSFVDFNINGDTDPDAAVILLFNYNFATQSWIAFLELEHAKPIPYPAVFENFTSIEAEVVGMKIDSLVNVTLFLNSTDVVATRNSYWPMMFKNDLAVHNSVLTTFRKVLEDESLKSISSFSPSIAFQPITTAFLSHTTSNGGNSMGLSESDGPLTLFHITMSWDNASDDIAVADFARNLIARVNSTAYATGKGNPYIYQNYAAKEQKVFEGYGKVNHARLRKISKKYDPQSVFQKLQPGYFKL